VQIETVKVGDKIKFLELDEEVEGTILAVNTTDRYLWVEWSDMDYATMVGFDSMRLVQIGQTRLS